MAQPQLFAIDVKQQIKQLHWLIQYVINKIYWIF